MSIYASVTGMVTKEGGLPALDARRERMGWTRTLVRVNVETGEVQRGPLPYEEPLLPATDDSMLNPTQREACRLVIDEGMSLPDASRALGKDITYAYGAIQRAMHYRLVERDQPGEYRWSDVPVATAVRTYRIEEVEGVDKFEQFVQLMSEGMGQKEAAKKVGYAPGSSARLIQRALHEGRLRRVRHGVYARADEEGHTVGLTEQQVREIAGQVVSEAVKEAFQTILSQLEGWIERAVQDQMSSVRKSEDALAKRIDVLARNLEGLKAADARSGVEHLEKSMSDTVATVHEIANLVKSHGEQIRVLSEDSKGLVHRYDRLRDELTLNSRSIAALEADVEDLQKVQSVPKDNVAELALRIIAAERGLTA